MSRARIAIVGVLVRGFHQFFIIPGGGAGMLTSLDCFDSVR